MSVEDPLTSSLGSFPVLQIAVAGVAVVVALVLAWRALKSSSKGDDWMPTQYYVQGPISKVIGLLEAIHRELKEFRAARERVAVEDRMDRERLARDEKDRHDEVRRVLERVEENTRRGG